MYNYREPLRMNCRGFSGLMKCPHCSAGGRQFSFPEWLSHRTQQQIGSSSFWMISLRSHPFIFEFISWEKCKYVASVNTTWETVLIVSWIYQPKYKCVWVWRQHVGFLCTTHGFGIVSSPYETLLREIAKSILSALSLNCFFNSFSTCSLLSPWS